MSKSSLISIDPVWTRYAQGLQNTGYIANKIFPIISVAESDKSGKIPLVSGEHLESSQMKRAPHGRTPVVNGNPITGYATYAAELNVLSYGIDITERKGKVLDMYKHGTFVVSEKVLLERERRTADLVRNNALYTDGNTSTPTNKWNNTSTSDPLADFETAFGVIETNVGSVGLKVAMGGKAWRSFKNHPLVKEMIKYSQVGVVTPQLAAQLLEVDEIIVGKSVYKDPNGSTRTDIWSDDVIIFGTAPAPGQRTLYTAAFGWTPAIEGFDAGPAVDRYTSEDKLVEYVRAWTWEDSLFHGSKLGYLLRDVNS